MNLPLKHRTGRALLELSQQCLEACVTNAEEPDMLRYTIGQETSLHVQLPCGGDIDH